MFASGIQAIIQLADGEVPDAVAVPYDQGVGLLWVSLRFADQEHPILQSTAL